MVGVGGPVGSGKTALMDALCKRLRDIYSIVAITNDIYTLEDAQILTRSGALPPPSLPPHAATSAASTDTVSHVRVFKPVSFLLLFISFIL